MAQNVNPEVLEGLKALQTKIEEGEKSKEFYRNQVAVAQEALDRETARVAALVLKLDEAKQRLGVAAEESLVFDDDASVVKTATEADAEKAALEA